MKKNEHKSVSVTLLIGAKLIEFKIWLNNQQTVISSSSEL